METKTKTTRKDFRSLSELNCTMRCEGGTKSVLFPTTTCPFVVIYYNYPKRVRNRNIHKNIVNEEYSTKAETYILFRLSQIYRPLLSLCHKNEEHNPDIPILGSSQQNSCTLSLCSKYDALRRRSLTMIPVDTLNRPNTNSQGPLHRRSYLTVMAEQKRTSKGVIETLRKKTVRRRMTLNYRI